MSTLLTELQSAHARDWGGIFVRYDTSRETEATELIKSNRAKITALFPYGYKVQLAATSAAELEN